MGRVSLHVPSFEFVMYVLLLPGPRWLFVGRGDYVGGDGPDGRCEAVWRLARREGLEVLRIHFSRQI